MCWGAGTSASQDARPPPARTASPASTGNSDAAASPLLTDALASLECEIVAEHPTGDHWIVVGRVDDLHTSPSQRPARVLRRCVRRAETATSKTTPGDSREKTCRFAGVSSESNLFPPSTSPLDTSGHVRPEQGKRPARAGHPRTLQDAVNPLGAGGSRPHKGDFGGQPQPFNGSVTTKPAACRSGRSQ